MADLVLFRSYTTANTPADSVGARLTPSASLRASRAAVRRPLRGLSPKKDTYAQFAVHRAGGSPVQLYDQSSTGGRAEWVSPMLIQNVSFSRTERMQPYVSFGAVHFMFFGEHPVTMNVSAVLLDTHNFEQVRDFWANYDQNLRGTRLVESGARVVLAYSGYILQGYLTGAGSGKDAASLNIENISFTIAVTDIAYEGEPGDTSTAVPSEAQDADSVAARSLIDGSAIAEIYTRIQAERMDAAASAGYVAGALGSVLSTNLTYRPTLLERIRAASSAISGVVADVRDFIADAQRAAEDFLLGRDNYIPGGYEGGLNGMTGEDVERVLADARYDETAMAIARSIPGLTMTPTFSDDASAPATDRWDEYIENRPETGAKPIGFDAGVAGVSALEAYMRQSSTVPTADSLLAAEASSRALAAYGAEYPGWTVSAGYQSSALIRALGTATYGVVRMAATATGVDALLATAPYGVINLPDDGTRSSFADARASAIGREAADGGVLSGQDAYALSLEERRLQLSGIYRASDAPPVSFG